MKTVFYLLLLPTASALADPDFFTPDPEHPGLYMARPVTLVHTVRPKRRSDWKEKFYEEYKRTGKPPEEWFTFNDGVWTGAIEQVNVENVDFETLYSNGFFRDRTRKDVHFATNPKPEARWLYSGDPKSIELWKAWAADPKNLAKPNRFSWLKTIYDIDPRPEWIWHSAFYDEYNIAGEIKHSLKQPSVILRNNRMLADSKVFVPRFMNLVRPKEIYHRSCGELFRSVRLK